MEVVLDQAAAKAKAPLAANPPIPILAQAARGVAGVEKPYDMAVIVAELAVADGNANGGDEGWLQQFGDAARFQVHPEGAGPDFEADTFWGNERLGKLFFKFEERPDGNVKLKIEEGDWVQGDERHALLLRICRDPEFLTIYFDTGHTFSRGQFYKTQFRDARFVGWKWVNMRRDDIDVGKEKSLVGQRLYVANIGGVGDTSLFGLVARHWPHLEQRTRRLGGLYVMTGQWSRPTSFISMTKRRRRASH